MRYTARLGHKWTDARWLLAVFVATSSLTLAACSDSNPDSASDLDDDPSPSSGIPSPTYTGPGVLYTIEAATQLHLEGVGIGVGNIWEEEYTSPDGVLTRGLTALLAVTVEQDPSQNVQLRVHPGQEVDVPGFHVQVASVEEGRIHLAVVRVSP